MPEENTIGILSGKRGRDALASERMLRQAGFGLLESLVGLIVFVILSMVGTKAFHAIVANHKESAQLKSLTDAVMETAEKLSGLTIPALTAPSAGYTSWSAPQAVALGTYVYRYRIVPNPTVAGVTDTTVVGLQVETGTIDKGAFIAVRSFATLIAPHVSSKNSKGELSTLKERQAEAVWYSSLLNELAVVAKTTVPLNQTYLNSFSCYNKPECCSYMERYFKDPTLNPKDGLDEKCNYRCALAGDVQVKDWNKACGTDFCALAPWKTKEQCCAAIAAGTCKPGSVCANICIGCVGEDGTTCNANVVCDDGWWNDFFDCANGTYCNGQALPDVVPEWGNVKAMCKTPKCAAIASGCEAMKYSCCAGYWQRTAAGLEPWAGSMICATITKQSDCCDAPARDGYYDFNCSNSGTMISATYFNKGITYCGAPPGSDWDKYCTVVKGCPSTVTAPGTSGACGSWPMPAPTDPWVDPDPTSTGVHGFNNGFGGTTTTTTTPPTTTTTPPGSGGRTGSKRGGGKYGSGGGFE